MYNEETAKQYLKHVPQLPVLNLESTAQRLYVTFSLVITETYKHENSDL